MSENELLEVIKKLFEEHSKNLVSTTTCNARLWTVGKWITPVVLSLCGAVIGMLLTIKVDISRIDTVVKSHDIKLATLESTWKSIDYKLDVLLGKNPKLADKVNQ